MFGLGEEKKKKVEPFVYDLEKQWKDPEKSILAKQTINARLAHIKTRLRTGGSREEMRRIAALLNAYGSLLKVMARLEAKKNK